MRKTGADVVFSALRVHVRAWQLPTLEIQIHLHVVELLIQIDEVSVVSVAGIVHENLDGFRWTELDRSIHELLAVCSNSHVALDRNSLRTDRTALYDIDDFGGYAQRFRTGVADDNVGTTAAKLYCYTGTDTPGTNSQPKELPVVFEALHLDEPVTIAVFPERLLAREGAWAVPLDAVPLLVVMICCLIASSDGRSWGCIWDKYDLSR